MAYDLGVDLGTTSTAAALVRDGHLAVCRLGGTSHVIPSVVSIREDGTILTGEAAERRSVSDPSRTVREFKRRLGDETPYVIGGTPYGAEVLTGYLLRDTVAAVVASEGEAPRRLALSHPATWGAFKLELLADAVRLAGVPDAVFVPEPVAAAVAYARRNPVPEGSALLVYDFGGGTFDAAVVRIDAGGASVVGTPEGLARLGGIDFDLAVLAHVDEAIGGAASGLNTDEPESRAALARLRDDCRQAKEALSSDTEAEIPVILPSVRTSVRLTRVELEALAAPRLADTAAVMDRVVAGAGLRFDQLAAILLVGGTSRMPMVAEFVRGHTGKVPATDVDPLLAIANGAALFAESGLQGTSIDAAAAAAAAATGAIPPAPPPFVAPPPVADEPASSGGRRRAFLAAIVALILVLAGVAALATLGGGGDGEDQATGDPGADTDESTTTTDRDGKGGGDGPEKTTTTEDPETSTTSAGGSGGTTGGGPVVTSPGGSTGGGPVVTAPPTVATTARPTTTLATTTTLPTTPYFERLDVPSSVSCAGMAATDRVGVEVSWSAKNAESVTVAVDSPGQIWETGLPTDSFTVYSVTCDGSKTSTTAIVTANGLGGTGKTETRTVSITF